MTHISNKLHFYVTLLFLTFFISFRADASHIIGGELYYRNISGLQYEVTVALYGDCAGGAFGSLNGATATVDVYNNNTLYQTIDLSQTGTAAEITPVCPGAVNSTTCTNPFNTTPGVKKFIYTSTIALNATSANWLFVFNGQTSTAAAARSGSITNLVLASNTNMQLEATLNNTGGANSSPTYTTVPTPFFCLNKPANFNPGAVDPNNDSLSFALVPGINAYTSSSVNYVSGYSGANPLATIPGSFSFNGTDGQLSFTPSMVQTSMVVYKITETRNGVIVGTSMREMNFIARNNCNNNPPGGTITNNPGGSTVTNNNVTVCQSQGAFSFNINASDPDGDTITLSWSGLPPGATFTATNNNSLNPVGVFSWNGTNTLPGIYTFFVTYTDHGCPLASKQSVAYTITVLPNPTLSFILLSPATCTKKAVFTVTPNTTIDPCSVTIKQGSTTVINRTNVTGTITDSLAQGTYLFSVKNANGCFTDSTITLAGPPPVTVSIAVTNPLCNGANNGAIIFTPGNGVQPFQYALGAGAYSSSNTFSGLTSGTYIFHIRDAASCVKDTSISLTQPPAIIPSAAITKPLCNGSGGSISIAATGGTPAYTYAIGAGAYGTNNIFTGLTAGTYTLHVKDFNGCVKDTIIQMVQPTTIVPSAIVTQPLCNGANGSIKISAAGGTPGYTYSINTGAYGTNNLFGNLAAGAYALHIRDTNGCVKDTVIQITAPAIIIPSVTITQPLCNGSNGIISVTAAGGVPGYTYAIGTGAYGTNSTFNNLPAGTYVLHIKDSNSCVKDTSAQIVSATTVQTSATVTRPLCKGSSGSINLVATGGTPGYTYAIGAGAFGTSNIFSNLTAGIYALHVKDANGCIKDTSIQLMEPPAITLTATLTQPSCNAGTGGITITATGGTPSYTFAIGTGAYGTNNTFSNLTTGTYILHIKDINGCIKDTTIQLTQPSAIIPAVTVTKPLCNGGTGSINISAAGGTPAYTYAIGTGAYGTNNTFGNLTTGTYILHIKDINGCIKDTTIQLTQPAAIIPAVTVTKPLCNGGTGSINISAAGGTPAYTYAIGTGAYGTNNTFSNLAAASYLLHIKDANGCVKDSTVQMAQPTAITLIATVTQSSCNGNNGSISLAAAGGTPGYTYAIGAGAFGTNNTFNNLTTGTYLLHIKDANGCAKDTSIQVTVFSPIVSSATVTQPSCYGNTGTISVAVTGGTPAYTYAIGSGAYGTNNTFGNLATGAYNVHVKDANGCIKDTTVQIISPTAIIPSVAVTKPSCNSDNGNIQLFAAGGTPGYTYALGTGNYGTKSSFSNLAPGAYILHVKDAKGCIKDTTVNIARYSAISINNVAVTQVNCFGGDNGAIVLDITGGKPPFSYQLNGMAVTPDNNSFEKLKAGDYQIEVTDSNGCKKDTALSISSPAPLVLTPEITPTDCQGPDNGGASVNVTGGTAPYTYLWNTNPPSTMASISGVGSGNYIVKVYDANNCENTTTIQVKYDDCCKPFIPDAFTPNGDGRNDAFHVSFKGDLKLQEFSIFDRYGQRVFYTIDYKQRWDGAFNGKPMEMGTYYYLIRIVCGNKLDNTLEFKGSVTLIR